MKGNATPEEVAAVVAAVSQRMSTPRRAEPSGYERWRAVRLAAVRRSHTDARR